jgi:hypothetical protein
MVTFSPAPQVATPQLRLSLTDTAGSIQEAPVESYVMEAPVEARLTPASYTAGAADPNALYRDPHLELADLFLAHETF